jgi:hypothetical protein
MPVPAGEENFGCYFGTFEEGGGIRNARQWTDEPKMMHEGHMGMKLIPDDLPVPDDSVADCRETGDWWFGSTQLYEEFGLPRGAGYRIEAGQRYAVDGHFINTTDDDAEVRIVTDLHVLPPEEITSGVGSFKFDAAGLVDIPRGGTTTLSFDCERHRDVTVHTVSSHMHSYGRSFTLDWIKGDGSTERVLDELEWVDGGSSDRADHYRPGSVEARRGDVFRTTCTWENTSDHALQNPEEMCMAYGAAYPLDAGVVCIGGGLATESADGGAAR